VYYDCCINSCVCYTGNISTTKAVGFAATSHDQGETAAPILYIPFIHGFKAFQSEAKIKDLLYRDEYEHTPGRICDVFDCQHYHGLLDKRWLLTGMSKIMLLQQSMTLPSPFAPMGTCFSNADECPSATPMVIQIYNLPPTIRTHLPNLMCLGVIPPPHAPKMWLHIHSHLMRMCKLATAYAHLMP